VSVNVYRVEYHSTCISYNDEFWWKFMQQFSRENGDHYIPNLEEFMEAVAEAVAEDPEFYVAYKETIDEILATFVSECDRTKDPDRGLELSVA